MLLLLLAISLDLLFLLPLLLRLAWLLFDLLVGFNLFVLSLYYLLFSRLLLLLQLLLLQLLLLLGRLPLLLFHPLVLLLHLFPFLLHALLLLLLHAFPHLDRLFTEVGAVVLVIELVSDGDGVVDVEVVSDVVQSFHNSCEFLAEDEFFAGEDDGDGEEVDVKAAILCREDAFPDPDGVEECEVLRVEERDPAEAVVERVDFEVVQALPHNWIDDLRRFGVTMSIWLTSLSLP